MSVDVGDMHAVGIAEGRTDKPWARSANAFLLLLSLAGSAVLVWWSVVFHPSNRQLWMVPFGLVLTGTPVVVWFSLSASDVDTCRGGRTVAPSSAMDLEK